jgi:hypothetical protein
LTQYGIDATLRRNICLSIKAEAGQKNRVLSHLLVEGDRNYVIKILAILPFCGDSQE